MDPPIIVRLNPSTGWPGGTRSDGTQVPGTLVKIHGRNFHPTPDMDRNQVTFTGPNNSRLPAPVVWASPNEIDYDPGGIVARDNTVPGGLDGPCGVAVDAAGNLFIADTGQHRIVRVAANGGFSSWGGLGNGQSQFNRPTGIAVDTDGDVYVADSQNHRIQRFNNAGDFVAVWGARGAGRGQYDSPWAIDVATIAGRKYVYVSEHGNRRVQRTMDNGSLPTLFHMPADAGTILGVSAPRGYGFCYATDLTRKRIYRWDWTGSAGQVTVYTPPQIRPMGIAQDLDGFVYVVDQRGRVVRKFDPFDPSFREIARFGLTIPAVPSPTPDDEFVDPMDVAVTDLKAAFVVDRQRNRVIRYIPRDAQEIWVHVPENTVTGVVRVRTDAGAAERPFYAWLLGGAEVADIYLTQGLVEYPLVAGKKTLIRIQMRTIGETETGKYYWGSPVHDSAVCVVRHDGAAVGQIDGEPSFSTETGGLQSIQISFDLLFEIPPPLLHEPGDYTFEVDLQRTNPRVSAQRVLAGTFSRRRHYAIKNVPISHLGVDGSTGSPGSTGFFAMDPGRSLDWVDWAQVYSGYVNYNRLFPVRHSLTDIGDYFSWSGGLMADGVTDDDESYYFVWMLEMARRKLTDNGIACDFMMGTIARDQIFLDDSGLPAWYGYTTTTAAQAILVSVGNNTEGDPGFDVGGIIGHELIHLHGIHGEQMVREVAQTSKDAWHSVKREFVSRPLTLMFNPWSTTWNDERGFVEAKVDGARGYYDLLFDSLANPHPKQFRLRERPLGQDSTGPSRPAGCARNFNLIGTLHTEGEFERLGSWLGSGDSPVTCEVEGAAGQLLFLCNKGSTLLTWDLEISYGVQTVSSCGSQTCRCEDRALVSATVPFPDKTARVVLEVEGKRAWESDVPEQPPTVRLRHVAAKVEPGEPLCLQWEADHPEGLELSYGIEVSTDGGDTYRPLALGLSDDHFDLQGLAAESGRLKIRVSASDGFNEVFAGTEEIVVGEAPARVAIVTPRHGAVIPEGQPLRLLALANNADTGPVTLAAQNTVWKLDGAAIIGRGNDLAVSEVVLDTPRGQVSAPLPVGTHTLSVAVAVAPGETVQDEILVEIVADSDRDGVPDDVEIERGTDPFDPGDGSQEGAITVFGQWRFEAHTRHTIFQISHLGGGELDLDLCLWAEDGGPLANHQLLIHDATSTRSVKTDTNGWSQIRIGALETVLVLVDASESRERAFGTSYVRLAKDSAVRNTLIQAHGWIVESGGEGVGEAQGTVVIQGGQPFSIRGVDFGAARRPAGNIPLHGFQGLGHLRMIVRQD